MGLINSTLFWWMNKRMKEIDYFKSHPKEIQQQQLFSMLSKASNTVFGLAHGFGRISTYAEFVEKVPLTTYEDFEPYIHRAREGEKNVLWKGKTKWFAQSSGTTNAKSKFIPISQYSLENCHIKGGKDMFTLYAMAYPETQIFDHINLRLGGSNKFNKATGTTSGDLSSILIHNMPFWADIKNVPNKEISLIADWNKKLPAIINAAKNQNIGCLTGVPSWMLVLLNRIADETNHRYLDDLWPNIEVFFHGGIAFSPYRDNYRNLFKKEIHYSEIYNASEGFFALQDQRNDRNLLLMLDYGIFYEFIPMNEFYQENPKAVPLEEVKIGINYALVISTTGGLWRYILGDTVKFTHTAPYRIIVSGRTKHYINAFGEELIIDNADVALKKTCFKTQSALIDYTAAPIFMKEKESGAHEWLIEFSQEPSNLSEFTQILDTELQKVNSDYEAKRFNNMTLKQPIIHLAPKGLFMLWMKKREKIGGQNKVPRLSNTREFIEPLLELLANFKSDCSN